MQNLYNTSIAFCLLLCLASCRMGMHSGSNTSFKTKEKNGLIVRSSTVENDTVSLFIEYAGKIDFNADHTSITSISPNGFLKYRKNDRELSAVYEDGTIDFELSNSGREVRSVRGKQLLIAEAFAAIKYTDSLRNAIKK